MTNNTDSARCAGFSGANEPAESSRHPPSIEISRPSPSPSPSLPASEEQNPTPAALISEDDEGADEDEVEACYKSWAEGARGSSKRDAPHWALFKAENRPSRLNCMLCCPNGASEESRKSQKARRGLIARRSGIGPASLKNHARRPHSGARAKLQGKIGEAKKGAGKRKREKSEVGSIAGCFKSMAKHRKRDARQRQHERDLRLLVGKGLCSLHFVAGPWLQSMAMHLDPRAHAASESRLRRALLPELSDAAQAKCASLLAEAPAASIARDLWMSRKSEGCFSVAAHFADDDWKPARALLGLVSCKDGPRGQVIAPLLAKMLEKHKIAHKTLAHASDGGKNLSAMRDALLEAAQKRPLILGSGPALTSSCFAHVMNSACSASLKEEAHCDVKNRSGAVTDKGASMGVKGAMKKLRARGAYIKKSSAGQRCWEKACEIAEQKCVKLPTPAKARFVTRARHLEKALEMKQSAVELGSICSRLKKKPASITGQPLADEGWSAAQRAVEALQHPSNAVTSLQSYEALSAMLVKIMRALMRLLQMAEKWEAEAEAMETQEDSLMGEDDRECHTAEELDFLARMTKASAEHMRPYVASIFTCAKEKAHSLASLMVDPRACSLAACASVGEKMHWSDRRIEEPAKRRAAELLSPLAEALWNERRGKRAPTPSSAEARSKGNSDKNDAWCQSKRGLFSSEAADASFASMLSLELGSFRVKAAGVSHDEDPLKWWKARSDLLPRLSLAAKAALSIPTAAIENERVFSISGILSLARRNRASAELLEITAGICCSCADEIRAAMSQLPSEKPLSGFSGDCPEDQMLLGSEDLLAASEASEQKLCRLGIRSSKLCRLGAQRSEL